MNLQEKLSICVYLEAAIILTNLLCEKVGVHMYKPRMIRKNPACTMYFVQCNETRNNAVRLNAILSVSRLIGTRLYV